MRSASRSAPMSAPLRSPVQPPSLKPPQPMPSTSANSMRGCQKTQNFSSFLLLSFVDFT